MSTVKAVKRAPSFPGPTDTQEPTNRTLWERVLELARGDKSEYTSGGKTIHSPNKGRGYYPWPQPNGTAWAVKQYKGLGGRWKPVKEASIGLCSKKPNGGIFRASGEPLHSSNPRSSRASELDNTPNRSTMSRFLRQSPSIAERVVARCQGQ